MLDKVLDRYAARGAEELEVGTLRSGVYAGLGTVFESDGSGLRLVEYEPFVRDQILKLGLEPHRLPGQWAWPRTRQKLRERSAANSSSETGDNSKLHVAKNQSG